MRKRFTANTVALSTTLLVLLSSCIAFAATMVIKLQDGSTVSYDTSQVSSVTFTGAVPTVAPPQAGAAPLFVEEFNSGLGALWEPIQVAGGNYEKFAAMANNKLTVTVPAGNSWTKTGILSRSPLFSVDANMASNPLKLSFEFDPAGTTGYVIGLSQGKNPDMWHLQNVWFHWYKPTFIEGKAYMTNTQNSGDKGGDSKTPPQAPKNVTLAIRPGSVEATLSGGSQFTANFSWMKPGVPVYLYIFSHPANQQEAAAFVLKSIKISQ